MDGQHGFVTVGGGRDEWVPGLGQGDPDGLEPFGHLGAGGADADPHLPARHVLQAVVRPDHRHPHVRHDATMSSAFLAQPFGRFPTGPTDSVLDVPGVGLGHATIMRDEADPPAGSGIARTGVTVVDPGGDVWASPVPAGVAVLNGAGELTGSLQIREWGLVETPVFLTSTMQVGRVYDAACRLLMAEQPGIADSVVIPVVGECDDSWLNDPRTMHVTDARRGRRLWRRRAARPRTAPAGLGGQR